MEICILQGKQITSESPSTCSMCDQYLNTCSPFIESGYLTGAECDMDYCECCPVYEDCGV